MYNYNSKFHIIPYIIGIYSTITPLSVLGVITNSTSFLVTSIMAALAVCFYFRYRELKLFTKPIILLLIFFVYQTFTLLWTDAETSKSFSLLIRMIVLFLAISVPIYNKYDKIVLAICFTLTNLLLVFMAVSGLFMINMATGRAYLELNEITLDQNYLSYLLLPSFAFSLEFLFESKSYIVKIICFLVQIGTLYTTLLMGTRGGTFSCLFMYVVFIISKYKVSIKSVYLLIVVSVITYFMAPLFLSFLSDGVAHRFSAEALQSDNAGGRTDIWIDVVNAFFSNPFPFILGYGVGNTKAVSAMATHNYILQILIEFGIVGLVLFFNFLMSFIKNLYTNRDPLILALFLSCMLLSMTLAVNMCYDFWMGMALCLSLYKSKKIEKRYLLKTKL